MYIYIYQHLRTKSSRFVGFDIPAPWFASARWCPDVCWFLKPVEYRYVSYKNRSEMGVIGTH